MAATETESQTVVLVDDTEDLRILMKSALERSGAFRVVGEAGDGAEGLRVIEEQQPDVVLLDLSMPVMDGLQALPLARRTCPSAKIVIFSGHGTPQVTKQALDLGADAFIQKGPSPKAMVAQLRELTA